MKNRKCRVESALTSFGIVCIIISLVATTLSLNYVLREEETTDDLAPVSTITLEEQHVKNFT